MSKYDNLSVGILAGGKSSRMGQNKALMTINNEIIIKRITDELKEISDPFISAAQKGIYEEFSDKVVYDENIDIGPIEGIRQVLIHATTEYVFVCASDMPFITKEIVEYMAGYICSDYDCYVLKDEEKLQPLCAIYSKKLLPLIEELISKGQYKLFGIISNSRTKYIDLKLTKFDKKIVKNINTKSDYIEAIKPVVFTVSGFKNSGKTGLIEKLINEFIVDGYTVATIKHDGHDTLFDSEGTDTERFSRMGAIYSVGCTDTRYVLNSNKPKEVSALVKDLSEMDDMPDIIILEGFKNSKYPKIEIVRDGISKKSVCEKKSLIAVVTNVESLENIDCPIFGLDDISGIFLCIKRYFNLER